MFPNRQSELVNSKQGNFLPAEKVDSLLHMIEMKYELLDYQVEGWCVWPILRFEVGCQLENIPLTKRDNTSLLKTFLLTAPSIKSFVFPHPVRHVVKTYTSGLVEREGIFYKDIWFDDLLKEIGDYMKIEAINNPSFISRRKAALIKSNLTTNFLDISGGILTRMSCPKDISQIARRLSEILNQELKLDFFTSRRVEIRLKNFYWRKKIYSYLLRRVHSKYLLTADPGEHALAAAAKEQGIRVVELQHGLINKHHYAYSWQANAVNYKNRMPIPDRLFLHGEYSKQELDANGFWGKALCVVGSSRMDHYRQRKIPEKREGVPAVVLTTQGIDVENTVQFMAAFLKASKGRLEFRLYIKLHPVYETDKTPYEAAFKADPRVEILMGMEEPSTFDLLARADFHLSISSTCHFDAMGLGVPSVILPLTTYENVLFLCEAGHAFLARTPKDLVDIMTNRRSYKVPPEIREYYFKNGALENMKRELC